MHSKIVENFQVTIYISFDCVFGVSMEGVREGERGVLPDIHEGPRGEGFGDGGCGEEDTEDTL